MAFIPASPRVGMRSGPRFKSMNLHSDELDPPFEILEPAELRGPVALKGKGEMLTYFLGRRVKGA